MSHFVVLVIGEDVEGQLAPYDENITVPPYWVDEFGAPVEHWAFRGWVEDGSISPDITLEDYLAHLEKEFPGDSTYRIHEGRVQSKSTYNPASKWDWYVEGGRWRNTLLLKNGLRVDSAQVGNIDLDRMRREAADEAGIEYDTFEQVVGTLDAPPSWDDYRAGFEDIEAARAEYGKIPFIAALREAKIMPWMAEVREMFCLDEPNPRATYIRRASDRALCAYAVVQDGFWTARGKMGWWGMSTDELTQDEWYAQVNALVDGLAPDTLITIVDAHI